MAVNDVVDLLRMLRRGAGEELERAAGPEAITLVEEIEGLVRERMRQSDMYFSLWDEFDTDPDSNRAELIGAIDMANAQSIAVHERLGFTHAGTIRQAAFKFGRWLDLGFWQLVLETPADPVDG